MSDGIVIIATGLHEPGCHILYGVEGGRQKASRWCWVAPGGCPICKKIEVPNGVGEELNAHMLIK